MGLVALPPDERALPVLGSNSRLCVSVYIPWSARACRMRVAQLLAAGLYSNVH